MTVEIIYADARDALAAMLEASIHTCITSPPYWGLRNYGLEPVVWGDEKCEHEWAEESYQRRSNDGGDPDRKQETNAGAVGRDEPVHHACCRRCSAWRGSLGLEPTPELYVEHIVQVMREVRRVLRGDGTLWLNLGDSYAQQAGRKDADIGRAEEFRQRGESRGYAKGSNFANYGERMGEARSTAVSGLKPKDLVGIPWRVAFALQADGWWLRSDIVWSKPNPMPESVTDRPTRSHEYLFLLTKKARYYYDADAIREPQEASSLARYNYPTNRVGKGLNLPGGASHAKGVPHETVVEPNPAARNKRSVWEIATQPYAKAHFATFPEKLVEPCVLAGCPEGGKVLDPFAGSGTVGLVAERLGRHSVLIDANEDYCRMARERTAQMGLFTH